MRTEQDIRRRIEQIESLLPFLRIGEQRAYDSYSGEVVTLNWVLTD